MSETIPEGVEKLLARLHATAEELANVDRFEGWVPGCDYEPIFKGSADLLDARDKIAALMAERTRQEERVRVLEEALTWYGEQARLARLVHSEGDKGRHALAGDGGKRALAALGNGGGDA